MVRKILVLITAITLIGCNTSKPVIVTSKKAQAKTAAINSAKKTKSRNLTSTRSTTSTSAKKNPRVNNSEVIVSTSRTIVTNDIIKLYVYQYKNIAMANMKQYGIPASIILAQGILESGAGKGDLAKNSNNHFGIKCHAGWTGESVNHDDDSAQECFRKYSNPSESFKDHAVFLTGRSRYAKLFEYSKGDYKAWAHGLRAAGYATDPKYPDKLISYIERYNLHQYDSKVIDVNYVLNEDQLVEELQLESKNLGNSLASYTVQKGDTLYSISKKFELKVEDLKQKNNLSDNTLSIGQKLIVN
ncbi:LysM domain-containing protein [Flavobacterium micromati]|uniref:Peptidoglycan hydrolase n=1 Tax=Flavobacterium micromati TaxID=229205 RepID=A0A1M5H8A6_9FLAO|nr:glucosaminidase domain-containing protein [Flavobacterium micromati]SHG12237.1 LysM domain-containing protein [Flavobacterium micromati]